MSLGDSSSSWTKSPLHSSPPHCPPWAVCSILGHHAAHLTADPLTITPPVTKARRQSVLRPPPLLRAHSSLFPKHLLSPSYTAQDNPMLLVKIQTAQVNLTVNFNNPFQEQLPVLKYKILVIRGHSSSFQNLHGYVRRRERPHLPLQTTFSRHPSTYLEFG